MSSDISPLGQTFTNRLDSLRQTGTDRLGRFGKHVLAALLYPYRTALRALLAIALAVFTFGVHILPSQPLASYQVFIANLFGYPNLATYIHVLKQTWLMNFRATVLEYGWPAPRRRSLRPPGTDMCGFQTPYAVVSWRGPLFGLTLPNLSLTAVARITGLLVAGGVQARADRR